MENSPFNLNICPSERLKLSFRRLIEVMTLTTSIFEASRVEAFLKETCGNTGMTEGPAQFVVCAVSLH